MAYNAAGQWQEEQDKEGQPLLGEPVVKTAGGVSSTGLVSPPAGNGMVAESAAPPARKAAGTGFVGVSDYLRANQNASTQLGNQIGGAVRATGDEARGALSTADKAFKAAVEENTVKSDPTALNKATGALGGKVEPAVATLVAPPKPTIQAPSVRSSAQPTPFGTVTPVTPVTPSATRQAPNAFGDVTNFLQNRPRPRLVAGTPGTPQTNALGLTQQDVAAINRQTGAQYQGPTSLEEQAGFGDVLKSIETAKQQAEALGSEGGRKALLQEQAKGPYSAGQTSFDNLLLGGQGQALNEARQATTAGLEDQLGTASRAALAAAEKGKATTDATRERALGQVQNLRGLFEGDISARAQAEKDRVMGQQAALKNRVTEAMTGGADLSRSEMRALGVDPATWVKIKARINEAQEMQGMGYQTPDFVKNWVDQNLGNYLQNQDANTIDANAVATAKDLAKQKALSELMGGDYSFVTGNAGNAARGPVSGLNEEALFGDLSAATKADFRETHGEALKKKKREREAEAKRKSKEADEKRKKEANRIRF